MNIFGSLMDIFDQKKQRHLCRKKKKDIYVERNKDIYVERNKGIYVENESFLHFRFVLRSVCTNFATAIRNLQFAILEYTPIYIIIVYESDSRHR